MSCIAAAQLRDSQGERLRRFHGHDEEGVPGSRQGREQVAQQWLGRFLRGRADRIPDDHGAAATGVSRHLFSLGITPVMSDLACACGMIPFFTMMSTYLSIIACMEISGSVN